MSPRETLAKAHPRRAHQNGQPATEVSQSPHAQHITPKHARLLDGTIRALAPHRRVAARIWPSRENWDKSRSWPTSWLRRALPPAPSNSTHPTSHTTGPHRSSPFPRHHEAPTQVTRPAWPCWDLGTGLTPTCWPSRGRPSVQPTLGSRDEETPV